MQIRMMRVVLASVASCLLSAAAMASPIIVTPSNNANLLASTLVALGGGVTVNSATYTGAVAASGTFTGAGDVIGIDTGILLTSGAATFVTGPNNSDSFSVNNLAPGSADLNAIVSPFTTQNASVLDINFTPSGSQVSFSYVFGSEEYNEFVNSQFNDVFAFFVNGVNFALIPGTSTPVSINTVNNGPAFGTGAGPCTNCAFYVENANAAHNTQLDGYTTVLTFVAPVNAGVPNIMRLAIADTSDPILDSAVFLQGGSLIVCGEPGQPPCPDGGGGGVVPEPASLILLGTGLAALYRRRAGRSKRT